MTTVRLRYTRAKNGNLFWEPTPEMRKLGFLPKPLGRADDAPAIAEAQRLYKSWLEEKAKAGQVTDYPPGSLGAYFDRYRRTNAWAKKAARTREDYDRAWKHLEPAFARKVLTRITPSDVETFVDQLEAKVSANERHRTIKVLRALFSDAIVRLQLNMPSPALIVSNPQPAGRTAIWLGAEVDQLVWGAVLIGQPGMAVAIRIAWDTMFSPVDVWTLKLQQIRRDVGGAYVERPRTKTQTQAYGALSAATEQLLDAYIGQLPFTLRPDSSVIRRRSGNAYGGARADATSGKNYFAQDFRAVRAFVFPGDQRQFLDLRRSGNVEADAAGADKTTMGQLLANGLAESRFLDATYTPPTVTKARQVAQERAEGRARLAGEVHRIRSKSSA